MERKAEALSDEIFYGYDMGLRLDGFQELSEFVAQVWNQPIPTHLAGTGKTAFSHAAEVHYVLPADDLWSFNAWSPKVLGNTDFVALCHYSGPMAIKRRAKQMALGDLDTATANLVLEQVRKELRHRKGPLTDALFSELVAAAAEAAAAGDRDAGRLEAWNRLLSDRS